MNKDLQKLLKEFRRKQGGTSPMGIQLNIGEEGALKIRGADGYTPQKGVDYWTPEEVDQMVSAIFKAAKPEYGTDYYTEADKRKFASEVLKLATPVKGRDYRDGIDGKDGRDGKDAEPVDARQVAIDAINFLESFEGDARLSAKALKDLDEAVTEILKSGLDFELSEKQITTIKDLMPKYPPINAGGSGATFLKSLRDVDLSGLTKNADGKYILGGSGASTFLDLTDTPATYAGQAGKFPKVNVGETALEFVTIAGGGDMLTANNLSDLANAATARTNLGLGTAAVAASTDFTPAPVVVSGSLTAVNNTTHVNVASATYTDPSPTEGKGFVVFVRNGTATVGGTGYGTAGTVIHRVYHSGAWANYVYQVSSTFALASHTHTLAEVTDVTASAAEVNILDGATLSTTELNYVDGVTSAIQTQLNAKEATTNKATDFSTVNDTLYPTVEAVTEYVASAVVGLLDYRGTYDASTNLYPATGGSGLAGSVLKGDFYIVSVAGTLGGTAVTAGDLVIALVDTPAQTSSNWDIVSNEVGYAPENVANKVTSISGASTDTQYPSAKLVYDQLALKAALASPTFTGTVTTPAIVVSSETASTLASFDASKNVKSLATASYPSLTEIAYVKGVTSAIQTQLNAKVDNGAVTGGDLTMATSRVLGRTTAGTGAIEELSTVDTFVSAASDTVAGKVELATIAETNTGTDATRAVTPDGFSGSEFGKVAFSVQVNGSASGSTALVTGDGQASIPIDTKLNGMNIIAVKAYVTTVSSSGSVTINIRRSRRSSATARTIVDVLSTAITIEVSEFESADATTAPVINTSNDDLATGDMLLIDIDAAGTGVLGLTVLITAQLP